MVLTTKNIYRGESENQVLYNWCGHIAYEFVPVQIKVESDTNNVKGIAIMKNYSHS